MVGHLFKGLARGEQRLRGDTAHIEAGAAKHGPVGADPLLGAGRLQAKLCCPNCSNVSGWPGPDDQNVVDL